MTERRIPAEVLREARRKDSTRKRERVLSVVDQMLSEGDPVTFASVARTAGVSNWLVYAEGVREHIEKARAQQAHKAVQDRQAGVTASTASLQTDLELARAEIRRLREERDKLKAAMQRGLGRQLNQATNAELVARIEELTQIAQRLTAERDSLRGEKAGLEKSVEVANDDLAAARTALRNMMRDQNRPIG
ncbi:hypothetical protein SAMN06272775_3137 [Streptomyces sp. 2323.1]|uniref:DUF6262 family protein n=1 Tax=Streptomyces sp. 2323.1 TaxID=1938841 RepID=UPI000BB895DF|nr:DUF6262 family protein [Streptomyces sp. 2323.1]SOE12146.1 hypothetical protein SAMN06272775_3137 [Streptomyces sp. 2323.1]